MKSASNKTTANPNKGTSARLRLRITAAAETIIRSGHPWLFAESIRNQNRAGQLGELAVIYDRKDRFLAVGLFDPDSPIRVRILHAGKPQSIDSEWWRARMEQALARRRGLFDEQTTGFRLINGESDGWPGLVLDRYDTTLVLKLYTAAWLSRLEEVVGLLANLKCDERSPSPRPSPPGEGEAPRAALPFERVVLRLSRNIQEVAEARFKKSDGQILCGEPLNEPVVFLENGLRFEADVLRGQKTGFFLDQRENRRQVESLASGRRVLNAFSFSGGFSVYAARGGASSVTDLDVSAHALASARRNFSLNKENPKIAECHHETVKAEAFEWLEESPAKFDLVVLDPPSLARREVERSGALRAYSRLARLGIGRLNRDGVLVACSCSAHVTAEEFFETVRTAVKNSRRKFVELQTTRHAPDHPGTFREAEYLKAVYLHFEPTR